MKRLPKIIWLAMLISLVVAGCKSDSPTGPGKKDQNPPMIAFSTSSVVFNAAPGSGNPSVQSVSVNNAGNGSLTGLNLNLDYDQNQPGGWLSASLNKTTAPATLTFQATASSLASGTYSASVVVSSPVASNGSQRVRVTLTVNSGSQPSIQLSRTEVNFSAVQGGASPSSQTVSVANGGGGSLTGLGARVIYSTGQPTGWLAASLSSSSVPSSLVLRAATGALAAGTYRAMVSVSSPVAVNSPYQLPVTFTVTAQQAQTGSVRVNTYTTGSNPTGYQVAISVAGGMEQSRNIGPNNYVIFSNLLPGSHTVTLSAIPSNCTVSGLNPRTVVVTAGQTTQVNFNITVQQDPPPSPRRLILRNQMSGSLNIHDIVQIKVASTESGVFTRTDMLTDDPARCMYLPGESVQPGQSFSFDVSPADYYVFIGIGIWDMDNFSCSYTRPFFKRTFFTDYQWNTYHVWVVVKVTDHQGEWTWNISGSYLNGTLKVTPAGNAGIPFNVTDGDPIP